MGEPVRTPDEVIREEEANNPPVWIYLSFVDEVFKGAAVVWAHGMASALKKCWILGINPGGEVRGWELEDGEVERLPDWATNRLLTRAQVEELFGECTRLGDL
jgi:hypothetical protein